MNLLKQIPLKVVLTILIMSFCFFLGYRYNDYKHDSEELVAVKAAEEVRKIFEKRENIIARVVEEKLSTLRANERIIEKRTREIVERPIYLSQCIDQDGLDIINSYAKGTLEVSNEVN